MRPLLFLSLLGCTYARSFLQRGEQVALVDNPVSATATTFWLEQIKHEGQSPFHNDASYKVFRNVKDYGARGDGSNDDTQAIQNAINDGNRNNHPDGVTGTPALVYFPSGTYKVSGTIQMWLNTALVGNPNAKPVIKPSDALGPNYVINGNDFSTQGTNNFYIAIRNIKIDTTGMSASTQVKALNWGVSQATSLNNVEIVMPLGDTAHNGIIMQASVGLSNTMIGDLSITGGDVGIRMNGQQLLIKSVNFVGCRTAIKVDFSFLLVLQDMHFDTCGTGVDNSAPATGLYLIDSVASNSGPALKTADTGDGSGSVLVENLKIQAGEGKAVVMGSTTLNGNIDTWAHGNVFVDNSDDPTRNHFQRSKTLTKTKRPAPLLQADGRVFLKKMPQYESVDVSQFASVKSFGAKGDGRTDDTNAIIAAISANAGSKVTYFPHGVYLVSKTITIPSGSRLVGEVWSVISGKGGFFGDALNPKPIVQIGATGSTGTVEITDILITISDILPGAIGMEVNMAGNPGDVSFHNTHFRIGGSKDSNVNNACGRSPPECKAGFLLLHVTKDSSAYFENTWGWTADHALEDGTAGAGQSHYISTGRGYLIESQKATWMFGAAPEHQTLYGLNINNAKNVYIAMAQIETPYWQPNPPPSQNLRAPQPWDVNNAFGDPNFGNCAGTSDLGCYKAWGMRVSGGSGILIYGIGTWTFFKNFAGDWSDHGPASCADNGGYCQQNAYEIVNSPKESYFFGLATKSIQNMVVEGLSGGGTKVLAKQNENPAGWGGHIVAYLGFSSS